MKRWERGDKVVVACGWDSGPHSAGVPAVVERRQAGDGDRSCGSTFATQVAISRTNSLDGCVVQKLGRLPGHLVGGYGTSTW